MSYAQENGYTPRSFEEIISEIREGINDQFNTTYDEESFVGTNWYKFAYAIAQKIQRGEVKASEVFQKLQEYINLTNEKIQRPSVSFPGIVESFKDHGFLAAYKPPSEADAGKMFICVDLDDGAEDFAEKKLEVCTLIKGFVAGGIVTVGDQVESIVLSNGQSFPFAFSLPDKIPIKLQLIADVSENNTLTIPSDEAIRQKIFDNIGERYRLGLNFEPQRYFTLSDALWASQVLLQWSDDDGENWHSEVYDAEYTDLFTISLEDIEVIIQ